MCVSARSTHCGLWTCTLAGGSSERSSHPCHPCVSHWYDESEVSAIALSGGQDHSAGCPARWDGQHTRSLRGSGARLCCHASPHIAKGCCGSWFWRSQPITGSAQGFGSMEAHPRGSIGWVGHVRQGTCVPFTGEKQRAEGAGPQ